MIIYEPTITVYGYDKEDETPFITVEGESRTEILSQFIGSSLCFDTVASFRTFVNELNDIVEFLEKHEPVKAEERIQQS